MEAGPKCVSFDQLLTYTAVLRSSRGMLPLQTNIHAKGAHLRAPGKKAPQNSNTARFMIHWSLQLIYYDNDLFIGL